jgi:hypothetical protein
MSFKKLRFCIEFPFTWLNNLKFVERTKSFLFISNICFTLILTLLILCHPVGRTPCFSPSYTPGQQHL